MYSLNISFCLSTITLSRATLTVTISQQEILTYLRPFLEKSTSTSTHQPVLCVVRFVDLKKLYRQTGVDNRPTVLVFSDTQMVDESFLEDINNVLSSREVPNL